MKKKSFLDIYFRNAIGVLKNILDIRMWSYGWPIGAALLPLNLTFGAGIKTLIDFISRKNIPEETLSEVESKIDALDAETIIPVINAIASYYPNAKSISSKNLYVALRTVEQIANWDLNTDIKTKKLALQKEQLGIDKNPKLLDMYKKSYIANLTLDEGHQKRFDDYAITQKAQRTTQGSSQIKTVIREYVSANHNYGKGMQHAICNYFFSPAPPTDKVFSKAKELTSTSLSNP